MIKVTKIPAMINPLTQTLIGSKEKRKVAAYARVSTDDDEQYTSYEAQVRIYTEMIRKRNDWEFVEVYADEGISGTSVKKRDGFKRMIKDAYDGKINLIITKSISRFARNTLDTLKYVRELKSKGVECYFEKENLWTFDSKTEFLLTIMASIAQEESRSISLNVTMGMRWAFDSGKVTFAYSNFLGYKKTEEGIEIDEDGAKTVKLIYSLFLTKGKSCGCIAKYLNEEGIKTPSGRGKRWTTTNIISILTNEKYYGDALLQKRYTVDYLEHRLVKNNGELEQYYIKGSQPPIISKEEWDMVQLELDRRKRLGKRYSGGSLFMSKLLCKDCGGVYGKKVWHSNSKYRKEIYQCNEKFIHKCKSASLTEEEVKSMFLKALGELKKDKDKTIKEIEDIKAMLTDTSLEDKEMKEAIEEMETVSELLNRKIESNSKVGVNAEIAAKKHEELITRYTKAKEKLEKSTKGKTEKVTKARKMEKYVEILTSSNSLLSTWSDEIWAFMVDKAVVGRDGSIEFWFVDGRKVVVEK